MAKKPYLCHSNYKKMNHTITFYIARHGKTLMNTLDKVQGWCDSPLTQEGIEAAQNLGAGLRDIHFESVYTSDLRRTVETAKLLLLEQGQSELAITEMKEFREACFGSYESDSNMKMWREAALYLQYANPQDMYHDVFNKKISSKEILNAIVKLDTMNMAETFEQLETRTQKGLSEIAQKEYAKDKDINILVVAHGMCIVGMLLNLGGRELLNTHLENASVCKVTYKNGAFKVESMGDMGYVRKGKEILNNYSW